LILLGHGENSIFDAEQRLRHRFPDLRTETIIADIKDEARIRRVLARVRPKAIFHAAAHKHVGLMEQNPEEAITNNVFGTLRLVRAAAETGVERFVMISTDKAVSPTSIMGASKRVAEAVVRSAAKRTGRLFCVVRFGNVLGSRGSVVPLFQQQIEAGGPVTVTHPDMKRFFMTIPEAVHLVLQAGGMAAGGDLFVLDMGEPVRIQDLVRDLTTLSGLDPGEIPILYTGIRPGEKLEEDLWEAGSKVLKTDNPDVLSVVEDEQLDTVILDHTLQALESATTQGRDDVRMILDAFLSATCPTRSGATLLKDSH
jgi:FlaA1/EpsC-like NDP-sugar epimerase